MCCLSGSKDLKQMQKDENYQISKECDDQVSERCDYESQMNIKSDLSSLHGLNESSPRHQMSVTEFRMEHFGLRGELSLQR